MAWSGTTHSLVVLFCLTTTPLQPVQPVLPACTYLRINALQIDRVCSVPCPPRRYARTQMLICISFLHLQIQSIASGLLEQLKFELVVVSPFLRCLQTAHHLLKVWDPVKPVRVVVDRQVRSCSVIGLTDIANVYAEPNEPKWVVGRDIRCHLVI